MNRTPPRKYRSTRAWALLQAFQGTEVLTLGVENKNAWMSYRFNGYFESVRCNRGTFPTHYWEQTERIEWAKKLHAPGAPLEYYR